MPGLQREYTEVEWTQREDYYTNNLLSINLPPYPAPMDLWSYTVKLENVMSEVYMDKAFVYQAYEYYYNLKKLAEKDICLTMKLQEIQSGNTKVTVQEVEGLTTRYLKKNPLPNTSISIYDICSIIEKRKTFIDSCIDILIKKTAILGNASTILSSETKMTLASTAMNNQAQNQGKTK